MKQYKNYAEFEHERGWELEHCAVCGEPGIPEHSEEEGDNEWCEILYLYLDGDSKYFGKWVDDDCRAYLDSRMQAIEIATTMRFAHSR